MSVEQTLCVEANLEGLERIRDSVEEFAQTANWSPDLAYQVILVLEELGANIVNYGCESNRTHEIKVTLAWDSNALTVEITDDGRAFNPLSDAPGPDLEAVIEDRPIGGLGIHLVRSIMDELYYRREQDRNHLTLIKRRNA